MKINYLNFVEQWKEDKKELLPIIIKVLSSGQYVGVNTYDINNFEKNVSNICKSKHAVTLNSGTDTLTMALFVSGVKRGDEVITVPNSYIATTEAIVHLKAKPVFVDVLDDMNIDSSKIANAITKKTKAILPVHLTGRMCKIDEINKIGSKYKIPVIEDAAQSFGSKYKDKICGSYRNLTCFSGHPLKNLNAMGDAGFMCLNNSRQFQLISRLKNHGLKNRDELSEFGYNSRLDNIQAAILNYRLKKYKKVITIRRKNAKFYFENLNNNNIIIPPENSVEYNSYHTFIIQIPKRNDLAKYLKDNGIDTYVHYPVPIHLQKVSKIFGYKKGNFPKTENQAKKILSLPIHHHLNENQLDYVCKKIKYFFNYLS